jgi:hypothetical protein
MFHGINFCLFFTRNFPFWNSHQSCLVSRVFFPLTNFGLFLLVGIPHEWWSVFSIFCDSLVCVLVCFVQSFTFVFLPFFVGAVMCGYAVDVNGTLVDGVVVEVILIWILFVLCLNLSIKRLKWNCWIIISCRKKKHAWHLKQKQEKWKNPLSPSPNMLLATYSSNLFFLNTHTHTHTYTPHSLTLSSLFFLFLTSYYWLIISRSRISPLPKKATRTIRIVYVEQLDVNLSTKEGTYSLPLTFPLPLEKYDIKVCI